MKRVAPWEDAFSILSDDGSHVSSCSKKEAFRVNGSNKLPSFEGALIRKAKMYQDFMKNIPIPNKRGSSVPFTSWKELGSSLKLLYNQPLHYLTNTLLSQWDRARVGSESENNLLDSIVHPIKAEAIIWANEEIHRLTFCHLQLAKLWALDPMYEAFIDSVLPSL